MILKLNVTESTNTAQKYSWTWWNPWTTLKLADNKPHSWNRLQPRNTVESNWRIIEVTFTLNFIYFSKLHCSVRNFGKKDNLCANPSRISSGYWYWKNMEEYTLIQINYCWGQSIRSGIKIAPWDGQQIFILEVNLSLPKKVSVYQKVDCKLLLVKSKDNSVIMATKLSIRLPNFKWYTRIFRGRRLCKGEECGSSG